MKAESAMRRSSSIPVAPTFKHTATVKRFEVLQCLSLRQLVGLLGWGISPSQGRYLTQTDINALSGIRTHNHSFREGEESSCLKPRGHCDGLSQ
jgi:hypothetical protein